MLFNSVEFLVFFPIVLAVYFVMPKKTRYIWLLITSYYFYMSWNPKYALLMLTSTVLTWLTGIGIGYFRSHGKTEAASKACVAVCCVVNLGILAFFKYFDFFLENINFALGKFGITLIEKPFDVLLPVGISFYTFQALSYIIDVYRNDVAIEKNLARYALFVSFFPQLVAGPIERSTNLLTQVIEMPKIKLFNYKRITNGLLYMLWGFFLKMVIADRAAILVDTVFDEWYLCGTVELCVGAVLFAIQIYCDFGSYSAIAIGASQIMGITLMENFEAPYLALSVKEFWRRWHISLSTWFRDYVYIPMGGNRCSKVRKYFNLMVTFLASGLWHGANWTFVIWGGLHGLYQIIGELLRPIKDKVYPYIGIRTDSICYKIGQMLTTFVLVDFAWIFFRANSITEAFGIIQSMITRWNPWAIADGTLYSIGLSNYEGHVLLISLVVLMLVDLIQYFKHERIDVFMDHQGTIAKGIFIIFLVFMIGIYGQYGGGFDEKQFIYFQF